MNINLLNLNLLNNNLVFLYMYITNKDALFLSLIDKLRTHQWVLNPVTPLPLPTFLRGGSAIWAKTHWPNKDALDPLLPT